MGRRILSSLSFCFCTAVVFMDMFAFPHGNQDPKVQKAQIDKEAIFQSFQEPFLQAAAEGRLVTLGTDFQKRIQKACSPAELFRLGLISGLTQGPFLQNEIDALFLCQGTFQNNLAAYLAGRFAGEQAARVYAHLQVRTLIKEESALGTLTEDYVQTRGKEIIQKSTGNDYFKEITDTLKNPSLIHKAQAILAQKESVQFVEAFAQALAAEYAVRWLQAYISDPSLESVLVLLPANVLALAGQLAFVRSGNRSVLLAAYTLAASKDKGWAHPLDTFVQQSIERRDATVFEAFLPKSMPNSQAGRTVAKKKSNAQGVSFLTKNRLHS